MKLPSSKFKIKRLLSHLPMATEEQREGFLPQSGQIRQIFQERLV